MFKTSREGLHDNDNQYNGGLFFGKKSQIKEFYAIILFKVVSKMENNLKISNFCPFTNSSMNFQIRLKRSLTFNFLRIHTLFNSIKVTDNFQFYFTSTTFTVSIKKMLQLLNIICIKIFYENFYIWYKWKKNHIT